MMSNTRQGVASISAKIKKTHDKFRKFDFRRITLAMAEEHMALPVSPDFRYDFKKKMESILAGASSTGDLKFSKKAKGLIHRIEREGIGGRVVISQQLPGCIEFRLIISVTAIRVDLEEPSTLLDPTIKKDLLKSFREFLRELYLYPERFVPVEP